MNSDMRGFGIFLVVSMSLAALAMAVELPPLLNWSAPATYVPLRESKIRALGDISSPVPFIAVTPCRQYDSRSSTPLPDNTPRTVSVTGAPCNMPAGAVAASANITVFNISGATGNGVFRVGIVSPPPTAWINYPPSETQRANAGALALTGGNIVVQVNQGGGSVDFTVDVNGYYSSNPDSAANGFSIVNASGGPPIYAQNNSTTCFGGCGLRADIYSQAGGFAVTGNARGLTGTNYGVLGRTFSSSGDGAGVFGTNSTTPTGITGFSPAGVRGDANGGSGVLGVSRQFGVVGALYDSGVSQLAQGILGFQTGGPTNWGVFSSAGQIGCLSCVKSFVDPHPTDPSKSIQYVSLEGPEAGTYFRGSARTAQGRAVIEVPDHFRWVTQEEGMTVQLTPVGAAAVMYVESQDLNRIVVRSTKDVAFHYLVQGIRPAWKDFQPIREGSPFMLPTARDRMPAGWTEWSRQRLIANGAYNEDGTVNGETAERIGWARIWQEREEQAKAARERASAGQR